MIIYQHNRKPLLIPPLDTVRMLDADIVCLQEVMFEHFDGTYQPFFTSMGYAGVMQNNQKRSSGHQVSRCVLNFITQTIR